MGVDVCVQMQSRCICTHTCNWRNLPELIGGNVTDFNTLTFITVTVSQLKENWQYN